MPTTNKPFLTWLPPLAWLIFITVLSVLPSVQLPHFDLFAPDKAGHALAYAGLTGLSLTTLRHLTERRAVFRSSLLIFVLAAGYGALMEFIQGAFLPNRAFEFDDMLANTCGAALGWAAVAWWFRRSTFRA
ncbi:MAG: VanZ family protein [Saprospiraceae bacterium]